MKKYAKPELETVLFSEEDCVMTASQTTIDPPAQEGQEFIIN